MTVPLRVRAPATTANIGPGFDCAAAALDLWNDLEVTEGPSEADPDHLGVRAFSLLASPEGLGFRFTNRIPIGRGLGSSAATVALGLVAATLVRGEHADPEALLRRGVELEGHPDNLATAIGGGVCLTCDGRIHRVAATMPAVPIALVPETTVETAAARAALPASVPHADAAFTAARAALLGAALASGSAELFGEALADRLHEPYRAANAPLLELVRRQPPEGSLGATISGSGPTVIVWAREVQAEACRRELAERFPDVHVLGLAVTPRGAEAF